MGTKREGLPWLFHNILHGWAVRPTFAGRCGWSAAAGFLATGKGAALLQMQLGSASAYSSAGFYLCRARVVGVGVTGLRSAGLGELCPSSTESPVSRSVPQNTHPVSKHPVLIRQWQLCCWQCSAGAAPGQGQTTQSRRTGLLVGRQSLSGDPCRSKGRRSSRL